VFIQFLTNQQGRRQQQQQQAQWQACIMRTMQAEQNKM
jgi:hypothetical protein